MKEEGGWLPNEHINVDASVQKVSTFKPLVRRQPTILMFGDSHTYAVQQAVQNRLSEGRTAPISLFRRYKEQENEEERAKLEDARSRDPNSRGVHHVSVEDFQKRVAELGPEDVVVSTIAGSEYAMVGTMEHPHPFDFYLPNHATAPRPGIEIVPYRAVVEMFRDLLARRYQCLPSIRAATAARMLHLVSPPPIGDNEYISRRYDKLLTRLPGATGVIAPPELRLKFWLLQVRLLQKFCGKHGVDLVMPPTKAIQDGFLRSKYYAKDSHHANSRYGELVIRSLEQLLQVDAGRCG